MIGWRTQGGGTQAKHPASTGAAPALLRFMIHQSLILTYCAHLSSAIGTLCDKSANSLKASETRLDKVSTQGNHDE
jgi:hypothetical protein